MKKGTKIKWRTSTRLGTYLGRVHRFGVTWAHIKWDDGAEVIVSREMVEEINEGG